MTTEQLERRVADLERTVAEVQQTLSGLAGARKRNWLAAVLGRFRDDPDFAEVVRAGREMRATGRLPDDPAPGEPHP